MTFLAGIALRWAAAPRWLRIAICIVGAGALIGLAWGIWIARHDRAVIADHETAVTAAVASQSAEASTAASDAVSAARTETEQANENARKAADSSDDPLRAGLDSLRAETRPHRPAAR